MDTFEMMSNPMGRRRSHKYLQLKIHLRSSRNDQSLLFFDFFLLTQPKGTHCNHRDRGQIQSSSAQFLNGRDQKNAGRNSYAGAYHCRQIGIDWGAKCVQYLNNIRLPNDYCTKFEKEVQTKYEEKRFQRSLSLELFDFITKCWLRMGTLNRFLCARNTGTWNTAVVLQLNEFFVNGFGRYPTT